MGKAAWPYEEFVEYLRALMDAQGISDFAELSRLTGVSQNQFSTWRRGLNQPSAANLRRIAPVLNVLPVQLYLAAGLNDPRELDLERSPDLNLVLPAEFRDLLNVYFTLSDDRQLLVRRSLAVLTAGLRADLGSTEVRPSDRRRAS